MATTSSTAVPFAQGQDVIRLRAAVDRSSQEIKDYTVEYEDQRDYYERPWYIPHRTSSTEACPEAEATEETGSAHVLFVGQQNI